MRFFASTFFALTTLALAAQPKQNSPYSQFGIGDPVSQYFAHHAGMGALTTANNDAYHLNIQNPASYAFLRATALETGLYAKFSEYKSSTAQLSTWSGNLNYFALGMTLKSPINEVLDRKKSPWQFGAALALTPYSLVGYNISTTETQTNLGLVTNAFEGRGGTYRLLWGGAAKYKQTAIGLNMGWMFGKAIYENTTTFRDSTQATTLSFQNNFRDEVSVNGLTWNLGAQHNFVLKYDPNDKSLPVKWLTAGLTFEGKHPLAGSFNTIRIRSRGRNSSGSYSSPDTLLYQPDRDVDVTLPGTISLALMYVKANKLKIGAQFTRENWSDYVNEARPENLRSTSAISAGVEIIPNATSYNRYSKRIRYRVGGYFRQDPRVVQGKNVDDLGLTFGFGFPVILPRQGTSFVNTAFELGRIGGGTAIEETYFKCTVGFTLNDNSWFYKRRFE
ncbi:MAG: hypothetical protein ACK4Q5_10340 [Saprospiraceae bacterium]